MKKGKFRFLIFIIVMLIIAPAVMGIISYRTVMSENGSVETDINRDRSIASDLFGSTTDGGRSGGGNIGNDSPERLKLVLDDHADGQKLLLKFSDKTFLINMAKYTESKRASLTPDTAKRELLKLIALEQGFGHREALRYVYDGLVPDIERWVSAFVDKAPVNAKLTFLPSSEKKFLITNHTDGRLADRDRLFEDLYNALCLLDENAHEQEPKQIIVRDIKINPSVLKTDLEKQTLLRSVFETSIASSSEDRKSNIALSLRAWNGTIIEAGETVSFNEIVGARTEARGYKTAKIILNGKFEDGVGGGVCQSSTTIYNAALLADMYINSANKHTLNVGYVEPSFDAMVNISSSDLEFTNRGDNPVYIHAFADGVRARVEFYGTRLPYKIKRKSVIMKRVKPPKDEVIIDYDGEYSDLVQYEDESAYRVYPKDGIESKGYLQYYNSKGKLIKEVLIRKDKYISQRGVLVRGAAQREDSFAPETELLARNNNLSH